MCTSRVLNVHNTIHVHVYIVPPTTPPSPTLPPWWPMIPLSFFYGALEFGEGEAWGREYDLAVGCRVQCKGIYLAPTEHMQHICTDKYILL